MHIPAPLVPGDKIAVLAPSSPVYRKERLERGLARLQEAGFVVEWDPEALHPRGYLAGDDTQRAQAINRVLHRTDIKGIICARGGYGALRLLDRLDYHAAEQHPKILAGFSDITALHLALYHRSGWRGLSGPVVAEWGEISAHTERQFLAIAGGARPQPLLGPQGGWLVPYRRGSAEGVLLGGNLSMVARLIGTPYLPPLQGALLFLEEVGEQPYRIDALFAQLKHAGILEHLGGLILGAFTGWEPKHNRPVLAPQEIFDDYLRAAPYPIATGLVYGHFPDKATMPVGVRARLTVGSSTAALDILEPVAAP